MIEWLAFLLAIWSSPRFEAGPRDWIYVTVAFASFPSFLQILGCSTRSVLDFKLLPCSECCTLSSG